MKGVISYFWENDVDGRARVTMDEKQVLQRRWTEMTLWRYGDWTIVKTCMNFVGKWEELVFNTFSDPKPVETAYDGSHMTGLRSFNDSKSKKVLDLLETV